MTDAAREKTQDKEGRGALYTIADARRHFSGLVARAEAGEEITISRGNHPACRLVPLKPKSPRRPGLASHWTIPDDLFLEAADEEELAIAAGEYTDTFGIWIGPPTTLGNDTNGRK